MSEESPRKRNILQSCLSFIGGGCLGCGFLIALITVGLICAISCFDDSEEKPFSNFHTANCKQGQIHQNSQNTNRCKICKKRNSSAIQQLFNDHGKTGNAACIQLIRQQKQIQA